jgi:hypothetical protein
MNRRIQRIALVLWPSFIVGGIGTVCFFSLFDPETLPFSERMILFTEGRLADDRVLIYSIGFFIFWMFAAASSWLTSFLQRSPAEVNREFRAPSEDEDIRNGKI